MDPNKCKCGGDLMWSDVYLGWECEKCGDMPHGTEADIDPDDFAEQFARMFGADSATAAAGVPAAMVGEPDPANYAARKVAPG